MTKLFLVFCTICIFSVNCTTKNILVLEGVASPSHHIFLGTLNRALAARGYNVTSLCAEDEKNSENLTYLPLDQVYQVMYNASNPEFDMQIDFFEMGDKSPLEQYMEADLFYKMTLAGIFQSKGYQQLKNYPKDFKFDLIINDHLMGPMLLPFVHHFNYPPLIGMTALHSASTGYSILGSTFYPSFLTVSYFDIDISTFFGRIYNFLLTHFEWVFMKYYITPELDKMIRPEFPDSPYLDDLMPLHKIIMNNKHPAVDVSEPTLPGLISIGGMQIQQPKPLPADLQDILDGAESGVILFSLGSNIQSSELGEKRLREILETLRQLPKYTIVWKFEAEDFPFEIPKNVIIRPWLPQSDILAHKNTILFITHGGLLSTQEATWYGVPLLNLPIFADQANNARISKAAGVGEIYNIRTVERKSFLEAILNVLEDPEYRKNSQIRSKNFQDQPQMPLDRAIWWIEWILRNPDVSHLRSPSLDINIPQRHSMDIIAFLTVACFLWVLLTLWMTRKVWRWMRKPKKTKKE
ncbi:UDP-glucosyltransferase 2-like [Lutzomyia longipalpis]|uniref:UDP-glucosyltransferase 2-like n=1 Tax=Lutzomyia longipalpis TaxID=7200 RepID=UPI0024832F67|nr:UDP-glucosyltransferase 2-like [Lutzomyia longipalpis]